ncbi:MAG TPA: hypothetical protein VGJ53_08075 [Micromonosporaceae bacterium]
MPGSVAVTRAGGEPPGARSALSALDSVAAADGRWTKNTRVLMLQPDRFNWVCTDWLWV